MTNVTNVTIVAPPAATASGRAFNSTVPAAPHLAAARPAVVQARAPEPVNVRHVMPYVTGHAPMTPAQGHPANGAEGRPMLTREGPPPGHEGTPAPGARPQPVAARPVAAPMQGPDARVVRGGTPAGSAQPMQAQSKAMKPAAQKTPAAAGTAVPPKNAAAPKGAAAHTESAKPGKPDNRKDAKGHEDGKQKHEGQ